MEPPEDQDPKELLQFFSYQYIKFVQLYKNLEDCYDQHVHPQKRKEIKRCLEAVMGRMLEVKEMLTKLAGTPFVNLDDILVDLKLIPETLELPVPRYFVDERRRMLEDRERLIAKLIEQRELQKQAMGLSDIGGGPGGKAEMSVDEAIRAIQLNERGRQGRQRAKAMKLIRQQEEKETRAAEQGEHEMDHDNAAIIIQKMWKGFVTAKKSRALRDQELVFIGMQEPDRPPASNPIAKAQAIRARRKFIQQKNQDAYENGIVALRQKILEEEGPDMKEAMMDKIRTWFVQYRERYEAFPDYPATEEGGSSFLFQPQLPPLEELQAKYGVPEEKAEKGKGDKKGGGKKDEKKGKGKGKGKDAGDDEETKEVPPSVFIAALRNCAEEFVKVWENRDESDNFAQHYDADLVKQKLRPGVVEEVRIRHVDMIMREELENIKMAAEKGKKGKKGKGKKGKKGKKDKGKKGKKKKDPTENRAMDSLFMEMVTNNILGLADKVSIGDYLGNYKNLDSVLHKANVTVDPSMAHIRQFLVENCMLPLGCQYVHDEAPNAPTILMYGHSGTGKTLLANAIANECGANFFDISPKNTDSKYAGKQAAMMLHIVFKVAKALAPSVIYIDDADYVFLSDKKKSKELGCADFPGRIKKDLIKELKALSSTDRVLIVGNARSPWILQKADLKAALGFFKKLLYLPLPDYATLQHIWKKLILKKGATIKANFDLQTLAHLSYVSGYSAGAIAAVIERVLTPRRIQKIAQKPLSIDELVSNLAKFDPVFSDKDRMLRDWQATVQAQMEKAAAK